MRPAIRPPRLRPGDRVAVVTPSAPLSFSPSPDPRAELERGLDVLRSLGLEPELSEHALAESDRGRDWRAGTAEERAADINRAFADPGIRAIVASHGGHVASAVLPFLDDALIAANPKVFMGFSNIVGLNLGIHTRTGLVTFHGQTVIWNLGLGPAEYELAELRRVLFDGGSGAVPRNSDWRTVRDGPVGVGRLIGEGSGLSRLAGTRSFPAFDEDVILFEEGMMDAPGIHETIYHHLDELGVLARTRGILVGHDGAAFAGGPPKVPMEELLADVTAAYDFPIVRCDDFGHGRPMTVLPVGVRARLDPSDASLSFESAVT